MERPNQPPQPTAEKLKELREAVQEKFGEHALFPYPSEGVTYLMTFDEALEVSGHHFAHFPPEAVIAILGGMRNESMPKTETEIDQARENGLNRYQKVLAAKALAQSSEA